MSVLDKAAALAQEARQELDALGQQRAQLDGQINRVKAMLRALDGPQPKTPKATSAVMPSRTRSAVTPSRTRVGQGRVRSALGYMQHRHERGESFTQSEVRAAEGLSSPQSSALFRLLRELGAIAKTGATRDDRGHRLDTWEYLTDEPVNVYYEARNGR